MSSFCFLCQHRFQFRTSYLLDSFTHQYHRRTTLAFKTQIKPLLRIFVGWTPIANTDDHCLFYEYDMMGEFSSYSGSMS